MAQMVLPQTPSPGTQKDPGPSKSGASRDPAERKTDFETVSQAEQKRLDREKSNQTDTAESADETRSADTKGADTNVEENASIGEQVNDSSGADLQEPVGSDVAGDGLEAELTALPLTFAELQAWLDPKNGRSGDATLSANGLQTVASAQTGGSGQVGILNGTVSAEALQKAPVSAGVTGDVSLTDMVKASTVADAGRIQDSGMLSGSSRFQSAMDLVSQQVASNTSGAAKLAAETAAPLRGYATSIDVPVGHAEWGDKLVGKLSWLTARNMSVAEIHLTPPDMGPMEVKVRVQNEQANITVHSANPVVRDQLELHSHRLRDMLGEQGLSLAGFDVSDSPRQQTGEQGAGSGDSAGADSTTLAGADQNEDDVSSGSLDLSWKGEVDIFA